MKVILFMAAYLAIGFVIGCVHHAYAAALDDTKADEFPEYVWPWMALWPFAIPVSLFVAVLAVLYGFTAEVLRPQRVSEWLQGIFKRRMAAKAAKQSHEDADGK